MLSIAPAASPKSSSEMLSSTRYSRLSSVLTTGVKGSKKIVSTKANALFITTGTCICEKNGKNITSPLMRSSSKKNVTTLPSLKYCKNSIFLLCVFFVIVGILEFPKTKIPKLEFLAWQLVFWGLGGVFYFRNSKIPKIKFPKLEFLKLKFLFLLCNPLVT